MHQAGLDDFIQYRGVLFKHAAKIIIIEVKNHLFLGSIFQHGIHDFDERLLPGSGAQVRVAGVAKVSPRKGVNFADDPANLQLDCFQRFKGQPGFQLVEIIPLNLGHEEIIRVTHIVIVIVKIDLRHGDGRILCDQAHGGHLGGHDILFILHNLYFRWRGDLKDDLPPIRQADDIGSIKPALFQLLYGVFTRGKPQAVESPGGHALNLLPSFLVLRFAFHFPFSLAITPLSDETYFLTKS